MSRNNLFDGVRTIVVIDWPSRDVPEGLARAGFTVFVRGGPNPEDYSVWDVNSQGEVLLRRIGHAPDRADLIYSYRPLNELTEIIETAKSLGAHTIWTQSGNTEPGDRDPRGYWLSEEAKDKARELVEAAGLKFTSEPFILDAIS